jgi:hypothetical protein
LTLVQRTDYLLGTTGDARETEQIRSFRMTVLQASKPAATRPALSRRFSVAPMMDWMD